MGSSAFAPVRENERWHEIEDALTKACSPVRA